MQRLAPRPMLEDLRALPRAFWVLFFGTFINRFGTFGMALPDDLSEKSGLFG